MYNPKSKIASEFICHEEIEETLAFAEAHKHDREMIRAALEKAENLKGFLIGKRLCFWHAKNRT